MTAVEALDAWDEDRRVDISLAALGAVQVLGGNGYTRAISGMRIR